MVNATNESSDFSEVSSSALIVDLEHSDSCSSEGVCGRCPSEEAARNGESSDATPSPPSPVGSDSWQKSNASVILRVESLLSEGKSLVDIVRTLCPTLREPPCGWSDSLALSILHELVDQPPRRQKLAQYNTFEDAIELFRTSKRILILTGAGVSVSCGIPDFRSKDGIYARLHVDFPDLPDPTAMFDIRYFRENPRPFYDFAQEIFPGQFEPSISHKFIRQLEVNKQLLRNYTQNIDTLENQTGIERVIECHGSFSKATCQQCDAKFDGDVIRDDVMNKRVPHCPACTHGIIKPDIVFFGEDLGQEFHRTMSIDKDHVDLLVVIGSSMKVRPVSLIPFSVDPEVPQILINREPLPNYSADIELLGNCDDVIRDVCLALGGNFTALLDSHDEKMKTVRPANELLSRKRVRREMINSVDFSKLMERFDKNDVEDSDEPSTKKLRLEDMYQPRYVSVENKLPENSYFQLMPNRAVFPGAEIFYDLEYKIITRRPMRYEPNDDDSSDDSSCDSDNRRDDGRATTEEPRPSSEGFSSPERADSCPPMIDIDLKMSAYDFRRELEDGPPEDFAKEIYREISGSSEDSE